MASIDTRRGGASASMRRSPTARHGAWREPIQTRIEDGDRRRGEARARGRCRGARRHRNGIATRRCVPGTVPGGSPRLRSLRTCQAATGCPAVWRTLMRQRIATWSLAVIAAIALIGCSNAAAPSTGASAGAASSAGPSLLIPSLRSRASCCRTMPRSSRRCCPPRCAASHRSRRVSPATPSRRRVTKTSRP